jgi:EpsI family protein
MSSATAAAGKSVMVQPLDRLPMKIADWSGQRLPDVDEASKRVLGADDYLTRRYARSDTTAVDLFVAFYASQRQGDAIHSPQNCLPGAGWRPVSQTMVPFVTAEGRTVTVNRYVIEKGHDRRVVYYWYHGRGRVVANEYANKAWLVMDAMTTGRSDGALVRAMAPATPDGERDASAFVQAALAPLSQALP